MTEQPPGQPSWSPPPPPSPGGYPPPPTQSSYPPPPPGGYPPPPSGYPPPPPGMGGYAPAPPATGLGLPQGAYTPWVTRVVGFIIDNIPLAILEGLAYAFLLGFRSEGTACVGGDPDLGLDDICITGDDGPSGIGWGLAVLAFLASLAFWVWNYGYRQGTTGQSIGKSIMKFKVVSEKTSAPIGFGMSIVRQLAHIIDAAICYIGYLFPLWDAKRQTIADKIMTTVCLPV